MEGGARFQPMKDKIYLCNDDKAVERLFLDQLGTFKEERINEWRQKVLDQRDLKVKEIEEKLNDEVKKANKELKRRQKLEIEFKSLNRKKFVPIAPEEKTTRQASKQA